MLPSYRTQSIDLHSKSIDWFLYEGNNKSIDWFLYQGNNKSIDWFLYEGNIGT